jgi:immunity protein, SdpI family
MTRWVYVSLALTAAAFAYSAWYGPRALERLPENVPVHWDLWMQPDRWASRDEVRANSGWYMYCMPSAMALIVVLNVVLPWVSPVRFKVDEFRPTFDYGFTLAVAMMGYMHAVILHGTLDGAGPPLRWMFGGMFLFFATMGNIMGKVRSNFWMGVRTPWTLASEKVWERTHRLAAWLWVAAGLAGFVCVIALPLSWTAVIGPAVLVALLWPVPYSLWLYKKLERSGQLETQNG